MAADYVVNGLLDEDSGLTTPSDALLRQDLFRDMTTEQVYDKLIKLIKGSPEGGGIHDGLGKGGVLGDLDADWEDVKDYDPADNQGKSASDHEREVAIRTATAAEASKAAGKETSTVRRFVSDVQVVKQPWYTQLQKYMVALTAAEFNWAKPDFKRSTLYGGMICPKMSSESLGRVIIGFDYSGSISDVQAGAMGAHCSDIMSDCRPSEVDVVYFDSEIKGNDVYTGPDYDLKMRAVGGGGTDFHPIIEYAEASDDCQLLIIFTDMYGPMPSDCSVPVLWVVDNKEVACFGDTIEADFND
jgi:predicted metal-dependent peptidase